MSYFTLVAGAEQVASALQTVLIARALGITDYGVYGLIFGTIGLAASVASLQMGLTGTVFVSRYRETDKAKAALIIALLTSFSLGIGVLFVVCTIPFAGQIARLLLGSAGSEMEIVLGSIIVAFAIINGVQDGVIQGFEDFRAVALTRLLATITMLALIHPATVKFGLLGTMAVAILGQVIKFMLLVAKLKQLVRQHNFPPRGIGMRLRDVILGFSLPAMLASLLTGLVSWYGTFLLTRQSNGFDSLAVVNMGLQWRAPIFFLTSSISSVAIPAISRHFQADNHGAGRALHRKVLLINGGFGLLACFVLIALSSLILPLYGPGFLGGALVFSLIVASAVPQVIAGVYLQNFVAKGRMWQQLLWYVWLVMPMGIGLVLLVPQWYGEGFAWANLTAWTIFAVTLALNAEAPFISRKIIPKDRL